ncbi:Translation initiation factor 2C [Oopsacas minuta]|uniref:Translation initiation factor 2C n=1 Tax=Oopsacas minuta TaxID=111878 RepID=A0AAV7KID0_9METZ|nr:Translation initiation factor 2C [Oopsacas minuta]
MDRFPYGYIPLVWVVTVVTLSLEVSHGAVLYFDNSYDYHKIVSTLQIPQNDSVARKLRKALLDDLMSQQDSSNSDKKAKKRNFALFRRKSDAYPVLPVSTATCFHCYLYPLLPVSTVNCIHCYQYPLLPVSIVTCIHCYQYPLLPVSTATSIHCYLYPLLSVSSVTSIHCYLYPLLPVSTATSIHCYRYPLLPVSTATCIILSNIQQLVESMDAHPSPYSASVLVQQHRQEIITEFKPQRIIFFRDGVSEGQVQQVLNQEWRAVRESLEEDQCGKSGNIPAGTTVDVGITHPTELISICVVIQVFRVYQICIYSSSCLLRALVAFRARYHLMERDEHGIEFANDERRTLNLFKLVQIHDEILKGVYFA